MTDMIRIQLVDDHTIVRQGLKQLLEMEADISVVAESCNGEEAVMHAMMQKPDVILMDINLPKLSGYEATRAILTAWPLAKLIMLTNQDDGTVIQQCMAIGAKGFLLKDVETEVLISGIRDVHAGRDLLLSPELADKAAHVSQQQKMTLDILEKLTQREKEVLIALSKGYSNQQLADLLIVSPKTVHNHLYNVYSKIGVKTRAEAIVWVLQHPELTS